jgi:hypothetical protein
MGAATRQLPLTYLNRVSDLITRWRDTSQTPEGSDKGAIA